MVQFWICMRIPWNFRMESRRHGTLSHTARERRPVCRGAGLPPRGGGAAAVGPVRGDGKILMVKQYRNAIDRMTLEIPAGSRDSVTEDTRVCAARELEEETGYCSDDLTRILSLKTTVAFCDEFIDVYLAKNLKPGHQHLDEGEFIDVAAYGVDELCDMIYAGTIQDAKTVAGILAYKNLLNQD